MVVSPDILNWYKDNHPEATPPGDALYGPNLKGKAICGWFGFIKDMQGGTVPHYEALLRCGGDEAESCCHWSQ